MRRTENNRRPSAGSQPWTSHFRPGRVLRDLLEPMFWGSSAYSDFFGQSTPTTHMPVQRNLRARPCSGRPDPLAGGPRRTCRPWRPVANASRRGPSTRLSHGVTEDEVREAVGRAWARGIRRRSPHCVPQPATGSSSPTHRFPCTRTGTSTVSPNRPPAAVRRHTGSIRLGTGAHPPRQSPTSGRRGASGRVRRPVHSGRPRPRGRTRVPRTPEGLGLLAAQTGDVSRMSISRPSR